MSKKVCIFKTCKDVSRALGYCQSHYDQYHRNGEATDTTRLKNGQTSHPLYKTWQALKLRCYKKDDPHYKWYGARDIKVCQRWQDKYGFTNFLKDMGDKPKGYSLDRIDNDGDYAPSNCRWADIHTQNSNRSTYNTKTPGVTKRENGTYRARLMINQKSVFDKTFDSHKEASHGITIARQRLLCR